MESNQLGPIDQELFNLFDQYVHGVIDRRGFLDGAGRFAVGGMTATMLLDALSPRFAQAQQIPPGDRRLKGEFVTYASAAGSGKMRGYLVRPAQGQGPWPGVLVIHENRGLNPHIEDVARRMALEGFVVFAPDALAPLGGYPGDEDAARAAFAKLDQQKTREDFVAAAAFLRGRPETVPARIGVVGFCWGGGMANLLAARLPEVAAAVPFYGMAPPLDQVPHIKGALLIHYAENDDRINASRAAYEAALRAHHIKHQIHVYPGTQHGFNNDTTPRYDKAAAALAWKRTIDFLKAELDGRGAGGPHPGR